MLELIAKQIKYYEDLIIVLNDKEKKADYIGDKAYYHGLVIAYQDALKHIRIIEREYEENVQSVEESMRFLRGE